MDYNAHTHTHTHKEKKKNPIQYAIYHELFIYWQRRGGGKPKAVNKTPYWAALVMVFGQKN